MTPEGSKPIDNIGGNQGFRALAFRGVPVVADEKCTAGYIYTLNEKHLDFWTIPAAPEFGYQSKYGFIFKPWAQPVNQDAMSAAMLWYGQLISDSPRTHAVRTGVTS